MNTLRHQCFEEIVVAVDDRHIDLRFAGFRTDAVVDQESVLLPRGDQVAVRSERAQDLFGRLVIELLLFGDVPGQFEQRLRNDGGVNSFRILEIPADA